MYNVPDINIVSQRNLSAGIFILPIFLSIYLFMRIIFDWWRHYPLCHYLTKMCFPDWRLTLKIIITTRSMEMLGNNTSNNFNIFKYQLYGRSIVFKNNKLVDITKTQCVIVEHFFRFQCYVAYVLLDMRRSTIFRYQWSNVRAKNSYNLNLFNLRSLCSMQHWVKFSKYFKVKLKTYFHNFFTLGNFNNTFADTCICCDLHLTI